MVKLYFFIPWLTLFPKRVARYLVSLLCFVQPNVHNVAKFKSKMFFPPNKSISNRSSLSLPRQATQFSYNTPWRYILTHLKTGQAALNREVVAQLLACMKFGKGLFCQPSCACAISAVKVYKLTKCLNIERSKY